MKMIDDVNWIHVRRDYTLKVNVLNIMGLIYILVICEAEPCKNGGTCKPTEDGKGYTCVCVDGYAGDNCETGIIY